MHLEVHGFVVGMMGGKLVVLPVFCVFFFRPDFPEKGGDASADRMKSLPHPAGLAVVLVSGPRQCADFLRIQGLLVKADIGQ